LKRPLSGPGHWAAYHAAHGRNLRFKCHTYQFKRSHWQALAAGAARTRRDSPSHESASSLCIVITGILLFGHDRWASMTEYFNNTESLAVLYDPTNEQTGHSSVAAATDSLMAIRWRATVYAYEGQPSCCLWSAINSRPIWRRAMFIATLLVSRRRRHNRPFRRPNTGSWAPG